MVRAIVWKELREQVLIAAMLAVLGGALLVAAATFGDPPSPGAPGTDEFAALGAGRMLALMLVVTAGMVCGGALFAAERESGTMPFLEALPTARWPLWRAKVAAGLVLAALEVGVLLAVTAGLGLADGPFLARLVVYALLAFAWGAFGSTLARTTLGSVGVAIPAASAASFLFLLPITIFFAGNNPGALRPAGWALFEVLMLAAPLGLSAWRFTAPDRLRAAELIGGASPGAAARARPAGWGFSALAWLTLRQMRPTGAVLSAFALAFGLSLLLPEVRVVFVWPPLVLAAGVLAGVTAFGDEQSHRTGLFWGEFRLPVGRAWWVKVGLHLALLGWLILLLALPSVFRAQLEGGRRIAHGQTVLAAVFRSRLFDELGAQGWKYLLAPAAYGFAFGHVCGLLFRKLVVACGVAAVFGGVAAAAWGPSLLAGGVRHWQVLLPTAIVLLAGRLLMRPWAADRASARGGLLRLAGAAGAAGLVLAGGLAYRVLQVPDTPGGEDDVAFVASLPPYDQNVAGREFRMAAERAGEGGRPARAEERLAAAVRQGWPADDEELDAWLDQAYADEALSPEDKPWYVLADAAAARPTGVYDPPNLVGAVAASVAAFENARRMALAILGKGLQQGARGDPARFVPAVRTVLALARDIRYGGGLLALEAAIEIERATVEAADRWAGELPAGRADLARDLARALAEGDGPAPFDLRPYVLADRFVVRGMMQAPAHWLADHLNPSRGLTDPGAAEADLVALAWAVPWERERARRLVGMSSDSPRFEMASLVAGRPGGPILMGRARAGAELTERELYLRFVRRAVGLKAAVLAYRGDRGRPPARPEELVGAYLPRLPDDPFAKGRPLGYRVSAGEELAGGARPAYPVAAGQVVIWSVGQDRTDDGGKVAPGGPQAKDLVFLVPAPAAP